MNLSQIPRRSPAFKLETMDDDVLLYDPSGTQIMQFNQAAAVVWQLCDGQRTVGELIAVLQEAYPESADEIAVDVPEILEQFAGAGCIQLP